MRSEETRQEESDADKLVFSPEQQIITIIAALEAKSNEKDPPLGEIRSLIKILKGFFALYSQGKLPLVRERDFPPEVWQAIAEKRLPW